MKIHEFDGKQYVALGDLDRLRYNLIHDIYDKYEKDENGYHLNDIDQGMTLAYHHIMVEILHDQFHEANVMADGPESMRKNHDDIYARIKREWMEGKYVIVATEKTTGEPVTVYYKGSEDGEGDESHPVFTTEKRKAFEFDDHYRATTHLSYLKSHMKDMGEAIGDLKILPLYMVYMTKDAEKRLFNAIFGKNDEQPDGNDEQPDGNEYCIFLAPDPDDKDDQGMWFNGWIKHKADMPDAMKNWLKHANVAEGDSAPLFSPTDCMTFAYKGMAEKTAERIAEKYPLMKGRLFVMIHEDAPFELDAEQTVEGAEPCTED